MRLRQSIFRAFAPGCALGALLIAHVGIVFAQQETPPAPGASRQLNLPRPVEKTLRNGLRIVVIEDHDTPLVSAKVLIKNGSEVDPRQLSGLAQLTASLLTKGTQTRTATATAQAIEALGGELNASAGWDSSEATVTVISSKIAPAVEVLSDVIRHPAFKEDELERLRQQTLDSLNVSLSQPGQLAVMAAARVVFGESAYGHPPAGTPQSIARIQRADVARLHASYYTPNNSVLIFSGDIRAAAAFKLAERLFGAWPKATLPEPEKSQTTAALSTARVIVIDLPNAGQAAVMLARQGLRRTDPDYYRGLVANSLFGGGYSSRLNQEVRIKRGLSYGAGSTLSARRATGPFFAYTQTKNESAAEVASLMLAELARLAEAPLPEAELQPRRANLIGNYGRALETTEGLAAQVGALAMHGVRFTEINDYLKKVQAVTEAEVRRFAAERLKAKDTSLVIVGDARKFIDELRRQFPQTEVIEHDQLDLEHASLRKSGASGHQQYHRHTLDLYFVDVEGGAATLIVTPASESVLLDAGWGGFDGRDARRIQQAMQQAGVKEIDHLVATHYHRDHYGGIPELSRLVTIRRFYDHGPLAALAEDPQFAERYAAYQAAAKGVTATLKAGDTIPLKTTAGTPRLTLFCVAANAEVIGGESPANTECAGITAPEADTSENGRSVALRLSWGGFDFLNLVDLTWPISQRLVCPANQLGEIELYQMTHHGGNLSNNPVLLRSLRPTVAVMINGPRKGGHPDTIKWLRETPSFKALYQLHRNVQTTAEQNAPADFIANLDEQPDTADMIIVSVDVTKRTFSVTNGRTKEGRSYLFK